MSDISSSPDKQARAGDSLAFHRIGRLRVPLGKLVEHPKNPNSRAALNGDQVALSSLEADFAEWNEVYGPTFNDDVYCLTGVVRWSRDAPRNAMQELRHLAASGGGDSLLPGYVETVQVASGLHRWNWAREQKLDSLRFELYGPGMCRITMHPFVTR